MRIRTVKPSFWPHRMHQVLSEPAALLALGLLNVADDEGRFEALPSLLSAMLFPRRPLSKPIGECLQELNQADWIKLYKAKVDRVDVELGVILNFKRHQVINRPTASTLPAPPPGTLTERSRSNHGTEAGTFTERSVDAAHGKEGRKEVEGMKEGGTSVRPPSRSDGANAIFPTLQEVIELGRMQYALDEEECGKFFDHYNGLGWMQGNTRISHWPSYLSKWKARFEERKKTAPQKKSAGDGEKAALRQRLESETDPARRQELLKQVAAAH